MQQILVNLIALAAFLFLARMVYRSFMTSRRSKQAACNGCGTCEAAKSKALPNAGDLAK